MVYLQTSGRSALSGSRCRAGFGARPIRKRFHAAALAAALILCACSRPATAQQLAELTPADGDRVVPAGSGNQRDRSVVVEGGNWRAGLTAGKQTPGYRGFLMSGDAHRGVSLRGSVDGDLVSAEAFSMSDGDGTGAGNPLGIGRSSGYIAGTGATFRPIDLGANDLSITSMTYFGEQAVAATNPLDPTRVPTDDIAQGTGGGWGTSIDSAWLGDRLDIQAETATSRFDSNGSDAATVEDDSAYAVRTSYDVLKHHGSTLRLGAGWERVGTNFHSLANPDVAPDRNTLYARTRLTWASFSGTLNFSRQDDNADDRADIPTDRTYSAGFTGRYEIDLAPVGGHGQGRSRNWLGKPFLLFGASTQRAIRLKTPAGFTGDGTDRFRKGISFGIGSDYDHLGWQADYQLSNLNDRAVDANDSRSSQERLSFNWSPAPILAMEASVSACQTLTGPDDTTQHNYDGSLGFRTALDEKLDLSLHYDLNLATGTGDTPDQHRVTSEMNWTFRKPDRDRPGIALALQGLVATGYGDAASDLNRTDYGGYLVLRVSRPTASR